MAESTYEISGTLKKVNPPRTFSSGSKCRSFWLETISEPSKNGKTFSNILEFEVFQGAESRFDDTAALDSFDIGAKLSFRFAPRGKIWNGDGSKPPRCFVSLRVIGKISSSSAKSNVPPPASPDSPSDTDGDCDSMPF